MVDNSDSALSGGLLVVLGIAVALMIGYFAINGNFRSSDTNIKVELPNIDKTIDKNQD